MCVCVNHMSSNLKRPYEDLVSFTMSVPSHYILDIEEDDGGSEDIQHTLYACQAYKGESFKSWLTKEQLKHFGIDDDGGYSIHYRTRDFVEVGVSPEFDIYHFVNDYLSKRSGCASEVCLILKPKNEIWFKCERLSQEEIEAAKKILEGIVERPLKRAKTQ